MYPLDSQKFKLLFNDYKLKQLIFLSPHMVLIKLFQENQNNNIILIQKLKKLRKKKDLVSV